MSGALFRESINIFINKNLSPAAQSMHLARSAKDGLQELIRTGRAPEDYIRYVDGRPGVPEETVKPDGVIVYRFNILPMVVGFALGYLRERSPVKSGRFKDSFFVAVDGKMIPTDVLSPKHIPLDSEVFIGNATPYNRRVDVQLDGTKPLKFSVPANMYRDCAKAVQRRFGGELNANRVYTIEFPGQYILKTGPRQGKRVHSPALLITSRGANNG